MSKNKKDLANEMIIAFAKEFYKVIGTYPLVSYSLSQRVLMKIPLVELEELVNQIFEENYSDQYLYNGIRNRTRKRPTVTFRQLYMKIAADMGYGLESIGASIGFDHATVIHAKKQIGNLLECKNPEILKQFNLIYHAANNKYGHDGDVQQDDGSEPITEPIPPVILDEREHLPFNDQHSSNEEGA